MLGHLFERSITDLERLRERGAKTYQEEAPQHGKKKGRRRREGVFYTNGRSSAISLERPRPIWDRHRTTLAAQFGVDLNQAEPFRPRLSGRLLARLDDMTVCDLACGSGAFLIAAYDWFEEHRLGLLAELAHAEPDAPECAGGHEAWVARSARRSSGTTCTASTSPPRPSRSPSSRSGFAPRGRTRSSRPGAQYRRGQQRRRRPCRRPSGLRLAGAFPEVFAETPRRSPPGPGATGCLQPVPPRLPTARVPKTEPVAPGGFDAVFGNPPYVRQELLGAIKPHLAEKFPDLPRHGQPLRLLL